MLRKIVLGGMVVFVLTLGLFSLKSAQAEDVQMITEDTVWSGNRTIAGTVRVAPGVTLTVAKGSVISFVNNAILDVQGKLDAQGTYDEQIVFRKENPGNSDETYFFRATQQGWIDLDYADVSGGGRIVMVPGLDNWYQEITGTLMVYDTAYLTVEHSSFHDSLVAVGIMISDIYSERGTNIRVNRSRFFNNTKFDVANLTGQIRWNFQSNWWGRPEGPDWTKFFNGVDTENFLTEDPFAGCVENCHSNVFFLPGIKASKLYKNGALGTEDQLWLPNQFGDDIEELSLDEDGKSIESVYTRDVLKSIDYLVVGGPLYKGFLDKLAELKSGGTINDYEAFAYDWRMDVEDIARDGTPYPDGEIRSALERLQALSESSKSDKVTIIAHSNGGLLAKAIMLELDRQGKTGLVDKIVFVGSPQMGTPLSVLSLLYGYDEPIPTLMSQGEARELAENMPGAYGLLPSATYFDRMNDPFIRFSSERTRYEDFKNAYGDTIGDYDEFKKFLLGTEDGRDEPGKNETDLENVLDDDLLDKAAGMHARLDAWTPPLDIQVIQIAGWGLDTVSGVEYTEKKMVECDDDGGFIPLCGETTEYEPVYEPKFTVDGDEVVVTPSALMFSGSENVKRYWVDLNGYINSQEEKNYTHRNLTEVGPVQQLLANIVTNSEDSYSSVFIRSARPETDDNESRLRMSLYSPLDIHLYDDEGRHTGPKKVTIDGEERIAFEEGIPNSYYYQFGDRKYVGFGGGEHIRVRMDGYATGSYTLKLQEVKPTATDEEIVSYTTFENLPTTADTVVSLDIPESGLDDLEPLEADVDGDDGKDYRVVPVPDGTATLGDIVPPVTEHFLSGTEGKNGWYVSDVTVTLTATDDEGGSGIDKTEYSLDDGKTWKEYDEPIILSKEGTDTLQYFSTDKEENKEEKKTVTIKIDKTVPEAKIQFNKDTQKLDITGTDNLTTVSVVVPDSDPESSKKDNKKDRKKKDETTVSLIDEAGHVTLLTFSDVKDKEHRIVRTLESISYDGQVTKLSDTAFRYKWVYNEKEKKYLILASFFRSGEMKVESHYRPKKDVTVIMEKPEELDEEEDDDRVDTRPMKKELSGLVVPFMQTGQGKVKISY